MPCSSYGGLEEGETFEPARRLQSWTRCPGPALSHLPPMNQQVGTTDRNRDAHGLASVTSERGGGPKILVFVHHKAVMAGLADAMEGAGGAESVPYVRIDGDTDAEDRWAAQVG